MNMKVKFFNQPYLLYVGDLPSPLSGKRLRIHVVGRIKIEKRLKAVAILGWMCNPEIHT